MPKEAGAGYVFCIDSRFVESGEGKEFVESCLESFVADFGDVVKAIIYDDKGAYLPKEDEEVEKPLDDAGITAILDEVKSASGHKARVIILSKGAAPVFLEGKEDLVEFVKPFISWKEDANFLSPMVYDFSSDPSILAASIISFAKEMEEKCGKEENERAPETGDEKTAVEEDQVEAENEEKEEEPAAIEAFCDHAEEDYLSPFKVSFGRSQGRTHQPAGIPCQDHVATYAQGDTVSAVLCDGAGSAIYAQDGSRLISTALSKILVERVDELFEGTNSQIAQIIFPAVENVIKEEIAKYDDGRTVQDYNSTFLSVTMKAGKAVIVHVGDGVVIARSAKGLSLVSDPENGEFSNETYFVTIPESEGYMHVKKLAFQSDVAFAMMSDGTERTFYSRKNAKIISESFLNSIFDIAERYPEEVADRIIKGFMEGQISRKVSDDDCSMCIIGTRKKDSLFEAVELPENERSDENYARLCDMIRKCISPVDRTELEEAFPESAALLDALLKGGLLSENDGTIGVMEFV